jgi:hypothetical protein
MPKDVRATRWIYGRSFVESFWGKMCKMVKSYVMENMVVRTIMGRFGHCRPVFLLIYRSFVNIFV